MDPFGKEIEPLALLGLVGAQEVRELSQLLHAHGFRVERTGDGEATANAVDALAPDAIVADERLPSIDALRLLEHIHSRTPEVCFVLITERPDAELAAGAMRLGAHDVQARPIDRQRLLAVLERGARHAALRSRVDALAARLDSKFGLDGLAGRSMAMEEIYAKIREVSATRATVLLSGETGTGKELLAAAIHHSSPRRDEAFVRLNCARLSEAVIGTELFGHERGAFPGADGSRRGRFEIADGGTLFLDEISAVTPPIQEKLLRVLRQRELVRMGGRRPIKVDVRVIAATSRNLEAEVRSGRFRQDFYYQLSAVSLDIPPLRRRPEDIPLLLDAFLTDLQRAHGKRIQGVSQGALDLLAAYSWPGNVRELKNTIEGMVLFAQPEQTLGVENLPEFLRGTEGEGDEAIQLRVGMTMAEVERRMIEATYRASGGDKPRTASTLRIGLRTLYRKLKEYDLG